jgi:hypothetical protein
MTLATWGIERWKEIFEFGGTLGALLFTGVALHVDARVRRAETLIEINKQHRELWMSFYERPQLARLLDENRSLKTHPLTDEEVRFANFFFNHLRVTFYAGFARIYVQPDKVSADVRDFFSYPAIAAAWDRLKDSHDAKFVAFVERNRAK